MLKIENYEKKLKDELKIILSDIEMIKILKQIKLPREEKTQKCYDKWSKLLDKLKEKHKNLNIGYNLFDGMSISIYSTPEIEYRNIRIGGWMGSHSIKKQIKIYEIKLKKEKKQILNEIKNKNKIIKKTSEINKMRIKKNKELKLANKKIEEKRKDIGKKFAYNKIENGMSFAYYGLLT